MPDTNNVELIDVFNENMERHPYPVSEDRLNMTDLKPAIARVWCYRGGDLVFQDRTNRDGKLNPCGDRYIRHGETPLNAAVKAVEDITGETPDTAEMLCAGAVPDDRRQRQIRTSVHTVWPDGSDVTCGADVAAGRFESLSPEEYMLIQSVREKLLKIRPRID